MQLPRYPGVRYPSIERLAIKLGAVYDQRVVLEMPNHRGGHRYLSLDYEQIEYPHYSMACRAIISHDAVRQFPDDPRKRPERQAKIEEQRRDYVEDHWRDIYYDVMTAMVKWRLRQPVAGGPSSGS